jgi:hypothetical protein
VTDITRQLFGTGVLPGMEAPGEIVVGDFNGDGRPDILRLGFGIPPPDIGYKSFLNRTPRTVPSEPLIGTAIAGDAQATISFTAPLGNGTSPITGYTATCSRTFNYVASASGTASPLTVSGLTNSKLYSCSVTAISAAGPSLASGAVTVRPAARATQVVEYLDTADFPNSPGGHFFYSSDTAEQAAIDAGAAGKFFRTSRQFLTGGTSPVCRFYGSVAPGPNSHFFTVDVNECNALKAAQVSPRPATVQQWNYEGISYATTPTVVATNGARSCPANTQPLYRAYNEAFPLSGPKNPWDSNHRFTPALADIAEMVAKGWRDEGIVFCTAQ